MTNYMKNFNQLLTLITTQGELITALCERLEALEKQVAAIQQDKAA